MAFRNFTVELIEKIIRFFDTALDLVERSGLIAAARPVRVINAFQTACLLTPIIFATLSYEIIIER